MKNTMLQFVYVLLMLRTLIVMGLPTPKDTNSFEKNSIVGDIDATDSYASVQTYTCVYIPPGLRSCNFPSRHITSETPLLPGSNWMEERKSELTNDNKENRLQWSTGVSGVKRLPKEKPERIIVYQIQRCVPSRLPFALPWCTKQDITAKESQIYRLMPFAREGAALTQSVFRDDNI